MSGKQEWKDQHPAVRFYSESKEWLDGLQADAAAQSMSVGDYCKMILSARKTIEQREQVYVNQGPTGVECCFCHQQVPDFYIDRVRAQRNTPPPAPEPEPEDERGGMEWPTRPPWVPAQDGMFTRAEEPVAESDATEEAAEPSGEVTNVAV